jgi:hypothetical protein
MDKKSFMILFVDFGWFPRGFLGAPMAGSAAKAKEAAAELALAEKALATTMAASEESRRNTHASFTGVRLYTPEPCCAMALLSGNLDAVSLDVGL